jgi:multisubunit Na+/H+ antiporter MnhB subunit
MKIDAITVAGLIIALMTFAAVTFLVLQHPFPAFSFAQTTAHYTSTSGNVGAEDSFFMWTSRNIDVLAQAFVLFTAAAGCLAVLSTQEKEEVS